MIGKKVYKQRQKAGRFVAKIAIQQKSRQAGFTIIESLMAVIVAGILLVAIAPVITLSVATRLQARRVELATQAARSYIDGLKTKSIEPPGITGVGVTLQAFSAPTTSGSLTCAANSYCTAPTGTSLYCVDFDGTGNCEKTSSRDMIVQAFRYNPTYTATNSDASNGYALGIRVYRSDAFAETATLLKNLPTAKTTQASFTGGAGQRQAPLVENATEINDTTPRFGGLCSRLGGCTD